MPVVLQTRVFMESTDCRGVGAVPPNISSAALGRSAFLVGVRTAAKEPLWDPWVGVESSLDWLWRLFQLDLGRDLFSIDVEDIGPSP